MAAKFCPPQTIELPSLDAPGTKVKLHRPFGYTKIRPRYEQISAYLETIDPFDTLPRLLIPNRRVRVRPPTLFYGWLAPREALFDYARANKLHKRHGRETLDLECIDRVLQSVNKKSGAKVPGDLLKIKTTAVGGRRDPSTLVVSLYSNYDLNRRNLPAEEAIETLREALGFEGPPKWFVDSLRWCWERW
ncbi:hypothetical protein FOMPIDRAFT_1062995 [Fomitopsis schrenkii]|uniref:Uncharacterized protein n=1 Tax=Fomitopsis schrenkii TaxID=2126942 RepID=S8F7P9_FOMSC|nr:hypothetical protein FOMPIDRAFT_1062995 [Fomitopsis schrenkii]